MAHRNVAAAGLIHIHARGRILTTVPASALLSSLSFSPFSTLLPFLLPPFCLFLSFSSSPSFSLGVAVQVTSITALNARRVPTSTSFCSSRDRCGIYPDSNIATEIRVYCRNRADARSDLARGELACMKRSLRLIAICGSTLVSGFRIYRISPTTEIHPDKRVYHTFCTAILPINV